MVQGRKYLVIGLGAGIAVALIAVQLWGLALNREIVRNANPVLLRPFNRSGSIELKENASDSLPKPWFPEAEPQADLNWRLEPMQGKSLTLGDFKGKVLFLNFWGTGCIPCIEEMPGIIHLKKSLGDSEIVFAAVTTDQRSDVENFLKENSLDVPIYLTTPDVPEHFGISAIPRTYILNKNGAVVFRNIGPLNWNVESARNYLKGLAARN
ncbi:MAG TPA: TlpA disulfide reductase family protein [Candidatus Acidoferrum sp.]|nr:TlpA disulfide reductase family protein [Candidatus Acidoferrum sp.]